MSSQTKSVIVSLTAVFVLFTAMLDALLSLILAVVFLTFLFVLQFAVGPCRADQE